MLKQKLSGTGVRLTSKEEQISRALLANYPVAGLTTVAGLADRSGVSVPTVLRFVSKMGFSGYPAFQQALVAEVSDQLNSPLSLFSGRAAGVQDNIYQGTMRVLSDALLKTEADYSDRDFEAVVDLLGDERSEIHCLGGRFSTTVAQRLALHLGQVRPGVRLLEAGSSTLSDHLVDYNSRVTLVAFDFRRYQHETIRFAQLAHDARARIVLFTDRWLSPINAIADRTLVSRVESLSPFDSWVPAFAQTEAIVAALAGRNPDRVRERLANIEALRARFQSRQDDTA
ncbi:MurR/RpiR family transcriptional regulator [Phaeovulum sp.]|uniref:MurR/RpiR family transcriptional regulator n=1 Tax=Phaeovulum sp. TaxID=2934796 RepID=UPI002731AEFF|nr:MurR/RpiR family transcriptional regulator [Phaeovulum sp.]MDP1668414.1 MurR/RpiR family transcriptional regulator [Phaeovulum sp.]MDZ4120091.1 MurR/RpiR family transcriptional regulator [Phaeovulum sp.]